MRTSPEGNDLLSTSVTLMGVSFPSFFLGVVLILLFAYVIPGHIFPPGGYVLTIEAKNSANPAWVVSREVPFRIKK